MQLSRVVFLHILFSSTIEILLSGLVDEELYSDGAGEAEKETRGATIEAFKAVIFVDVFDDFGC